MPISTTSRKAGPYPGNGVARDFSFNFKIFSTDELRVSVTNAAGAEQVLVFNNDYTVSLNPDQDADAGGVVTLARALVSGSRLVILSDVPYLQPIDMTNQGGFYPDVVNEGLDRATAQVQQLGERVGRTVTVPPSTPDGTDLSLPEPSEGKLLAWGANGLHNLDPDSLITFAAYGDTIADKFWADGTQVLFTLTADPASENNLRVSVDGVTQTPGEDFVWDGGTALRFLSAPPNGTRVLVQFLRGLAETGGATKADLIPKADRVRTIAELRAWPLARDVYVEEVGAWFSPDVSDRSDEVANDPLSAVWVAPDGQDGSAGAWKRVFDGMARLSWFKGTSTKESVEAASLLGYLFVDSVFPVDEDFTIDVPQYYEGGSVGFHIAAGKKLTISDTIHAHNQWIFSGEGDVVIPLPDEDSGEDIREVRAKWFGAFTQVPLNQSPRIQKAISALGNSREGVVWFDCGSYQVGDPMTVGRGVKIASMAGTRRTVFQVVSDGYPVFRTLHTACMFKDIQFENYPVSLARVSPFIQIDHDFCEITDIFHQSSKHAIVVAGANCKVQNIEGVYGGSDPGPNSSQILVQAEGFEADGVRARYSSGGGPTANVEIGTGATANVTSFYVRNVETRYGSTAVLINAANVTVARGQISDIRYRGSSAVDATVRIKTSGNGSVFGVTINNISGAATGTGLVRMEQASSGYIRDIMFDNIHDSGTAGAAFDLVQTAGELKDIRIGPNVVTSRPNLIQTTGTVTGIKSAVKRRVGKTASFSVPASGAEDGILYNVVSASAITATLPAEAIEPLEFEIASTGAGVTTLTAAAGATVNGGTSVALTAGKLYRVAVARNVGGTAAQWVVGG